MRLIDADKFEEFIRANCTDSLVELWCELVRRQPTIEAEPVVRGQWLIKEDESCFATWDYCSVCGFTMGFAGSSHYAKFCPNCGAKMEE